MPTANRLTLAQAEILCLFERMVPAARVGDYAGWYNTNRPKG